MKKYALSAVFGEIFIAEYDANEDSKYGYGLDENGNGDLVRVRRSRSASESALALGDRVTPEKTPEVLDISDKD